MKNLYRHTLWLGEATSLIGVALSIHLGIAGLENLISFGLYLWQLSLAASVLLWTLATLIFIDHIKTESLKPFETQSKFSTKIIAIMIFRILTTLGLIWSGLVLHTLVSIITLTIVVVGYLVSSYLIKEDLKTR